MTLNQQMMFPLLNEQALLHKFYCLMLFRLKNRFHIRSVKPEKKKGN